MIGISCCAWAFPRMNRQILGDLRHAGYELIDVRPNTFATAQGQKDAVEIGIGINCMGIAFESAEEGALHAEDERSVAAALDLVRWASESAVSLGASVAYVVPGQDGSQEALKRYGACLAKAADRAAAAGAVLCVEHFPGLSLPTARGTLDFLDEVDHPNLYLLLDLGHLQISNEDPVEVIERAGSRLGYVHLDDNDGRDDLHMPLLEGCMRESDLERTFAALTAVGYEEAVSLELSPKLEDPLKDLAAGYELVARLLAT